MSMIVTWKMIDSSYPLSGISKIVLIGGGGGGGGGGCFNNCQFSTAGGGGGGSGDIVTIKFLEPVIGLGEEVPTATFTVGKGGTGGLPNNSGTLGEMSTVTFSQTNQESLNGLTIYAYGGYPGITGFDVGISNPSYGGNGASYLIVFEGGQRTSKPIPTNLISIEIVCYGGGGGNPGGGLVGKGGMGFRNDSYALPNPLNGFDSNSMMNPSSGGPQNNNNPLVCFSIGGTGGGGGAYGFPFPQSSITSFGYSLGGCTSDNLACNYGAGGGGSAGNASNPVCQGGSGGAGLIIFYS